MIRTLGEAYGNNQAFYPTTGVGGVYVLKLNIGIGVGIGLSTALLLTGFFVSQIIKQRAASILSSTLHK